MNLVFLHTYIERVWVGKRHFNERFTLNLYEFRFFTQIHTHRERREAVRDLIMNFSP